ncbi:Conserved oligomeric Golgi complex subunit 2-like [Homarus americanus]|uniref:Conserved oligomeric Golgi complex subunit 2 n=1 Tax=Homarus americanus TaxID=6706 RepID=A0A8J5KFR2_HOMAM|nr:Conserved oligomeric Golgi complex subunit 2-like [Homarus americanus]
MAAEKNLPVQLYGTSSLCFDKDDFMKNDFSVDNFVRIHQAAGSGGLETLRDDLGVYLKILRNAMIELINRDYADFVNLSTNLTGLDRLIEALKTPLGQLREESVEKLLDDAISTTSKDLERRQTLIKQKALLHRLTQISNRLETLETLLQCGGRDARDSVCGDIDSCEDSGPGEGDLVDRLAAEVNHLNFLVSHSEGAALLDVCKPRVAEVCQFVEHGLERGLREGVFNKDLPVLKQTLHTYASLGSVNHAHQLVISEPALRSDPRGLPGMYSNTLAAVNNVCQPLLSVTTGHGSDVVRGYSFLERSAWPEIVTALETGTQHIFNPGNPATFHQRYLETTEFLESFEKLLGSKAKIMVFREMIEYKSFMEHWNLPVYFQIRYQEIGQVAECSLSQDNDGYAQVGTNTSGEFVFLSSQTIWESLLKCFTPEVFLPPLLHRFWKLTLLILSRYRTWITITTEKLKKQTTQPTKENLSISKQREPLNPGGEKFSSKSGDKSQTQSSYTRDTAVGLVHDVQKMAQKLPFLYAESIEPLVPHLPPDKLSLIKVELNEQSNKLSDQMSGLSDVIIQDLIGAASGSLRQVADTPRLYRRTNRAPPTSHQPYIAAAATTLSNFSNDNIRKIDSQQMVLWLTQVCTEVSEQYRALTYDVLSSVHKMEESLKRLKRARDRGAQGGAEVSGGLSDDDKIRIQICLDVEYFGSQIRALSIDSNSVESFISLLTMVQNARDGKFAP